MTCDWVPFPIIDFDWSVSDAFIGSKTFKILRKENLAHIFFLKHTSSPLAVLIVLKFNNKIK